MCVQCMLGDVCVLVGGTCCLAVRGEEKEDEEHGERVWLPRNYHLETQRQSKPSISNASLDVSTLAVRLCLFVLSRDTFLYQATSLTQKE